MEIKLKGGKKLKVKDVSIDERDELLDSVSYDYGADGNILGVKMMHSTMTKWLRTCLDGDISDEFLSSLSLDERTEAFVEFQKVLTAGEEKASK